MSSDAQGRSGRWRWRAPVTGAVAGLVVAAAIVGQAALADSGSNAGTPTNANAASAPAVNKPAEQPAQGDTPHQFLDAVAQLVQAGTIDAAQGRAVDAQIQTGRMDPQQLVSSGTLTASQMAAVNDRLRAVKESMAPQQPAGDAAAQAACGTGASDAGARDGNKPAGQPAPGGVPHQFLDAVAQLVQAGTIDAAQGRAVDAQIQTGRMDPQQLVSSGVLTASQMAAVNDRLIAIKESMAPQQPAPASDAGAASSCGKGAAQAPPA